LILRTGDPAYSWQVSNQNVEVLEGIYERWEHGDFRTPVADGFVLVMDPEFPESGEHVGPDGVSAYMKRFLGSWERITIKADEMFDGEDKVLVKVHQVGTGLASGIAVDLRYFQLWTFDGSTPIRAESIMEESVAMERIGGVQ